MANQTGVDAFSIRMSLEIIRKIKPTYLGLYFNLVFEMSANETAKKRLQ